VTVLVTGATGFAGSHLVRHLEARGGEAIVGTTLDRPESAALRRCDVTRPDEVRRLLSEVKPSVIYHLAAQAHVGESFRQPLEAIQGLVASAVGLLAAAAELSPMPRVLFVSSAEVYGASERPLAETSPLDPDSPYAVGKLAGEAYARLAARRGLAVVIARPFNHIGPGQSEAFACSGFAKQIAEAEVGARPPVVEVGNLSPERDFTDVRDTVRAYPLLLERARAGEAVNVASGRAIPVSQILDGLVCLARVPIEVRRSPARERAGEAPRRVGDTSKLRALGWAPEIPLEQTLRDTLEAWRAKLAR